MNFNSVCAKSTFEVVGSVLLWLVNNIYIYIYISLANADPEVRFSGRVQKDADILIPERPNTAHICSEHGPATAWLRSEWPGITVPFPKTFTLLAVHFLSQCDAGSHYQAARTTPLRSTVLKATEVS
jgi:hypothetical protein